MSGRIALAPKLHSTRKSASELRASCNLGVTKGAGVANSPRSWRAPNRNVVNRTRGKPQSRSAGRG
jgi:hypothetical protein